MLNVFITKDLRGSSPCPNNYNESRFIVECFLDENIFKANLYMCLVNSSVFIPWVIYVFAKTKFKMEKNGLIILSSTLFEYLLTLVYVIPFFI